LCHLCRRRHKPHKFRDFLEQRRIGYVVAVAGNQAIAGDAGTSRADVLAAHAPGQAWKRRSCGNGSKGPRVFDWAAATLPADGSEPPGWSRYLLVRRALTPSAKGELELACYLCCAPAGTTDEELIRVAGSRWAVEECFQTARNETGLDHYQVRRYDAWYRHATLSMLARAYLAVTVATAPKALAAASSRSRSARSAVHPARTNRPYRALCGPPEHLWRKSKDKTDKNIRETAGSAPKVAGSVRYVRRTRPRRAPTGVRQEPGRPSGHCAHTRAGSVLAEPSDPLLGNGIGP
jgi:hypothetical protein